MFSALDQQEREIVINAMELKKFKYKLKTNNNLKKKI